MKNHSFNHKSIYAPPSGGDGRGALFTDLHVGGQLTAHHDLNVLGNVHISGALSCAQVNNLDAGFFVSEQALLTAHPLPTVGMHATVLHEEAGQPVTATIYSCEQAGQWRALAAQVPVTVSWKRSSLPDPAYSIPFSHFVVIDSIDSLPPVPRDTMTGFVVDGIIYVFVAKGGDTKGGRYLACGPLHGIQGEQGPQGGQGPVGPQGPAGPQGIQGNTGVSIGENYELFSTLQALDGKTTGQKAAMIPDGNVVEETNYIVDDLAAKKAYTNRIIDASGASVQPPSGNGNRQVVIFDIAQYVGYTIAFASYNNYAGAYSWAVYRGDTTISLTGLSLNTDVRVMSAATAAKGSYTDSITVEQGDRYLAMVCYNGHTATAKTTKSVKTILLEDSTRLGAVENRLDSIETQGLNTIGPLNADRDSMVANLGYTASTLRLLHFSDLHYDPVNMQRIMDWRNAHADDIDDILNTGDTVNSRYGTALGYGNVEEVERILNTIGNHDIDDTGDGSYTHSGVDGYNTYLKPFINNWDVTQPDNAEAGGKCYYSKDYVAKGIRLVVLDTIVAYSSGSAQQTWFRQVLADARTQGLAVVVACHWLKGDRTAIPNHFAPWRDAWADFEGKGSAGSAVVCTDVQAFINNGGEFICYLVGHSHADHIGTMKNHPQQLCIAVGAANGLPPTNIYHVNHGGEVRRQGTRSQDNFNIIGINTSSHTITLVKIGIDSTIYAQRKDFIRINYLSMLVEE